MEIFWRMSYRCSNKVSNFSMQVPPNTRESRFHNCIPDACPIHSRYLLETWGRYYLYETGFLTVTGCLGMTRFQWKLNLWLWCSGVWPMNCFGRNRCHLGWVDLWDDKDLLGSEIPDHLDHGRSIHLIYHDPSDLRPLILIQIVSKSPLLIICMPREISKHRTGQPINQ